MIRNNRIIKLLLFAVVITTLFSSCDPSKKYRKEEAAQIEDYLARNSNLNFVKQPSGLYYCEVEEGSGRQPITHDTAYMKYTGSFLSGQVFDSNVDVVDPLIKPVDEGWLIPGYDEGITLMKEGGKAIFIIPSDLAYGPSGYYGIPGYTPLLFDVELILVIAGPGK
jgi:FKBP-type peptidyl-prolyl cis-trans isomerase